MKQRYFFPAIFFPVLFFSCSNDEELIVNPVADPYEVKVTGYSLVGDLEYYLDGEKVTVAGGSGAWVYSATLLKSKGERKLEVQEAGKDSVIHTIAINEETGTGVKFYWNGEEITDQLTLPVPDEGNIGFLLKFDMQETGYTEPADIEVKWFYRDENRVYQTTETLATIRNYIPGSGDYTGYIEVRAMQSTPIAEYFCLQLYKASTTEPYHTLRTQGWLLNSHCYCVLNQIKYSNFPANTTAIIAITEKEGSFEENNEYEQYGKTGEVSYTYQFIVD